MQVEKARKEAEDAKDNVQAAELLHEEERSKVLMLEDEKSKMTYEVRKTHDSHMGSNNSLGSSIQSITVLLCCVYCTNTTHIRFRVWRK